MRVLLVVVLMLIPTMSWAEDIGSDLFIFSLGLVNADGNITSDDLSYARGHYDVGLAETNPIAKPFAIGYTHYVYYIGACGLLTVMHDDLKHVGLSDVESIAIIAVEIRAIGSWNHTYCRDNIYGQILLSEAEVFISSRLLNIRF